MNFFQKNKTLFIIIVIVCGLIIMWGRSLLSRRRMLTSERQQHALFGRRTEDKEGLDEIIPVEVVTVSRMDYKDVITSFGTIKGFDEIPIRFKESGIVSRFYFKEGDEIKKGSIVVSQQQQEEVLKLEYAQIELNKNQTLYDLGAITLDKLRQSQLEVESAHLELEKRNFYAPSNGFMGTRKVEEGELVDPSDVVATFLDISNVFCEVGIIERDIGKVKIKQKVKIIIEAIPQKVFEGTVDSVSPMIEGRSRTQTVRILIPNKDYIIKPGMFARAEITTFERKNAIVIPKKALKKTEQGYVVFEVIRAA